MAPFLHSSYNIEPIFTHHWNITGSGGIKYLLLIDVICSHLKTGQFVSLSASTLLCLIQTSNNIISTVQQQPFYTTIDFALVCLFIAKQNQSVLFSICLIKSETSVAFKTHQCNITDMSAVREPRWSFCSHIREILSCASKRWWCQATAATVPPSSETCDTLKGEKPDRWQQFTLRVHEDMYFMWQVGWWLADKVIVGLDSRFILSQLQTDGSAHSLPLPRSLACFPHFFYCLSEFPRQSSPVFPATKANNTQMWWQVIASLCETAEMSSQRRWEQQQEGQAVKGFRVYTLWDVDASLRGWPGFTSRKGKSRDSAIEVQSHVSLFYINGVYFFKGPCCRSFIQSMSQ